MRRAPYITVSLLAIGMLGLPTAADAGTPSAGGMKQRGQSFEERAQTTLGGAKYFVQGRISSMDKDTYWIVEPSGDEVRLRVTESTNMVCPTRPGAPHAKNGKGISGKADFKGFRIGDCPFRVGDFVKAETTDEGTVSFIRAVKHVPTAETDEIGMPRKYLWLPVPLGHLDVSDSSHETVETWDGRKLGTLERMILDTKGTVEYGIVQLDNGRLIAMPWEAFSRKPGDTTVVRIDPTKEQMVQIPTFSMDTISTAKIREYWEGEAMPMETVHPSSVPWVNEFAKDLRDRSEFKDALHHDPALSATLFRYLNDAAEDLEQGKRNEAVTHFRTALIKLDEQAKQHAVSKATVEQLKAALILHAPQPLIIALHPIQGEPSIKMEEAIDIASETYPGEVIDAEYLGQYGKPAYRVAIMAGTGVTHAIEVDARTGRVLEDLPQPGHPMPNEPFR